MLYLAKVEKKGGLLGKAGLRLLARQQAENKWAIVSQEEPIVTPEASPYGDGLLVLVDVNNRQVSNVRDATDWEMQLVKQFLAQGITPDFLQQETERAEQWRQSLTLQSQDLARRNIELEKRRDQLQDLEEKLNQRERQVRTLEEKLKREAAKLKAQSNS